MSWSFAMINGRLAEIFFDNEKGKPVILGHCYVQENEYKTAREKKYIKEDTKKYRFTYRNKEYIDQLTKKKLAQGSLIEG